MPVSLRKRPKLPCPCGNPNYPLPFFVKLVQHPSGLYWRAVCPSGDFAPGWRSSVDEANVDAIIHEVTGIPFKHHCHPES